MVATGNGQIYLIVPIGNEQRHSMVPTGNGQIHNMISTGNGKRHSMFSASSNGLHAGQAQPTNILHIVALLEDINMSTILFIYCKFKIKVLSGSETYLCVAYAEVRYLSYPV